MTSTKTGGIAAVGFNRALDAVQEQSRLALDGLRLNLGEEQAK